jgi:hypothetical protein
MTNNGQPSNIPWSQLGARAGAGCKGDGLTVVATPEGARLQCVFQRLEGEATREGLWLTSTIANSANDRFRIVAAAVGRQSFRVAGTRSTASPSFQVDSGTRRNASLPTAGRVSLDGQTVRFIRPGLTEEYTVSMDGVRQDFVVTQRPEGTGQLAVQLQVNGATVEPADSGAQLILRESGRKIAYSRLRVTDATGKELTARIEVIESNSETGNLKSEMAVLVDDADAVYPIRIDPVFTDADWISMGGFAGANGNVFAAVADGVGNLYIGGDFTIVHDVFANNIAKWNGSGWSALGLGINGHVRALALSGTNLYAAGSFTSAAGIPATNIAKWDGSSWSALGSGVGGVPPYSQPPVSALAVSGTNLYAGGQFTTAGGIPATNIAKWDGNAWSALGSGITPSDPGVGWGVNALAVSGSDLYAGGYFTTAGGVSANNIAKWNGSSWAALGLGTAGGDQGLIPGVTALAVSGSDLYAGGNFTTAGGNAANYMAKWNGNAWSALGAGFFGGGPYVYALAVSGTDLYAAGRFTSAYNIAKWNGNSWSAFGLGTVWTYLEVNALAVSGSNVYAAGSVGSVFGGSVANNIAKLDGTNWTALCSGMALDGSASVNALAVSGSDVYAGGWFAAASRSPATNIARWNGSGWSPLGSGTGHDLFALAASGSDLYAAGGPSVNNVARWDGNAWSGLGWGFNNTVLALAVSGTDLYAGGYFTSAGGIPANYIARWDGNAWSALDSGMDYAVFALAVSGSDLYAGGQFRMAGGVSVVNIAKWDGSSWSALGSGISAPVHALAVSGTDLYAGGGSGVFKWDGSSWSALGSGMNGYVYALAVSGSDVYAGGNFTAAGGVAANHIAKWDGNAWSALGSGVGPVNALAILGTDLYVGGAFTTAGGKVSPYVARAVLFRPLLSIEPDGFGGYFIDFSGVPGSAYRLQRASALAGPWATSAPQIAPPSGQVEFWDLFPPLGKGFYRTVQP